MDSKGKIEEVVRKTYGDASPTIFKGHSFEGDGWNYVPFGRTAIFLGKSLRAALEFLAGVSAERQQVRDDYIASGGDRHPRG